MFRNFQLYSSLSKFLTTSSKWFKCSSSVWLYIKRLSIQNTKNPSKYLKNNLNIKSKRCLVLSALKKLLYSIEIFHRNMWRFLFLGLESGWMEKWWYPEQMSKIEKYFVPLSFDQMWSILAVSISTRLPLDFAWVVLTLGICLFIFPIVNYQSLTFRQGFSWFPYSGDNYDRGGKGAHGSFN